MKAILIPGILFSLSMLSVFPQASRETAELTLPSGKVSIEFGQPGTGSEQVLKRVQKGFLWRLGNNGATVLKTQVPLSRDQLVLQPGSYSLFARHEGGDEWILLFNRETRLWGTADRDPGLDVGIAPFELTRNGTVQDLLSISLEQQDEERIQLKVIWGSVALTTWLKIGLGTDR